MIKAIFFDLWDTIIYLCGSHPVVEIKKKLGLPKMSIFEFSAVLEKTIMTKKFATIEDEFAELFADLRLQVKGPLLYSVSDIWKKNINNLYFPPKIEEMLVEMRKSFKLALITNTDTFPFEFVRLRYGIEKYFDCIVKSFDMGTVKPDAKMFTEAIERLGLKPEEVIMCGDSPQNDIIPAKRLGMKTILIDTKRIFSDFKEAGKTVNNIKDFVTKLRELSSIEYQNNFVDQKA